MEALVSQPFPPCYEHVSSSRSSAFCLAVMLTSVARLEITRLAEVAEQQKHRLRLAWPARGEMTPRQLGAAMEAMAK